MALALCTMTVVGHAGRDAETLPTKSGKEMAKVSVAYSQRRRNASGEYEDGPTMWIDVVGFEYMARRLLEIKKGDKVALIGEVNPREYTNKNGELVRTFELFCTSFLGKIAKKAPAAGADDEDPFAP